MRDACALGTALMLVLAGCDGGGDGVDAGTSRLDGAATDGGSGEALISAAEGGEVVSEDGVFRLIVPPGALAEDTRITITRNDSPSAELEAIDAFAVYTLEPDGLEFLTPAIGVYTLPASVADGIDGRFPTLGMVLEDESGIEVASVGLVAEQGPDEILLAGGVPHFSNAGVVSVLYTTIELSCDPCTVGTPATGVAHVEYVTTLGDLTVPEGLVRQAQQVALFPPAELTSAFDFPFSLLDTGDFRGSFDFVCGDAGLAEGSFFAVYASVELDWARRYVEGFTDAVVIGFLPTHRNQFTCVRPPSSSAESCGDGVLNGTDSCDGSSFHAFHRSCAYFPGATVTSGAPGCTSQCRLDLSPCYAGITDPEHFCTEQGAHLAQLEDNGRCDVCTPLAPSSPTPIDFDCMRCASDGTCVDAAISAEGSCMEVTGAADPDCAALLGNGAVDPSEQCEGTDLNGSTCGTRGYAGGTLACDASGRLDFSGCILATCGDGDRDTRAEECDGADLNGRTCMDAGFTGGTLACGSSCLYDTSGCTGPGQMGNCCHVTDGVGNCSRASIAHTTRGFDPACATSFDELCVYIAHFFGGAQCLTLDP